MTSTPILAITMGDPTGTGPELLAKALPDAALRRICRPLVIGDASVMRDAVRIVGGKAEVRPVRSPSDMANDPGTIDVLDLANSPVTNLQRAKVSRAGGQAAYEYIKRAVELTLSGQTQAVVTSAINKQALHEAGHLYDGHTELLADLCGKPKVTMMLVAGKLRVCHVSTHVSLQEAIRRVTVERILAVVALARDGVRRLGVAEPHIALAGVNPHAGENGLFGDEEIRVVAPAAEEARRRGFKVTGPYAGDTVFFRTLQGEFDCAIAMYHDQGHVAAKMLGIWQGVNVTLGLPIVRTSVEHGTDFANAGTGRGDPRSLVEAIKLGATMGANPVPAT